MINAQCIIHNAQLFRMRNWDVWCYCPRRGSTNNLGFCENILSFAKLTAFRIIIKIARATCCVSVDCEYDRFRISPLRKFFSLIMSDLWSQKIAKTPVFLPCTNCNLLCDSRLWIWPIWKLKPSFTPTPCWYWLCCEITKKASIYRPTSINWAKRKRFIT